MISDNNLFGVSCLLPRDEPAFSDQPLPSPKKQTLLSALQTCVSFLKIEYRFFKMHSHYEKKSLGLWVIKHKKHATVEWPSLALCAEPAVVSARGVITCPWWTHAARCQQIFKSLIFGLCYFPCPQKTFRQRCCIYFFYCFVLIQNKTPVLRHMSPVSAQDCVKLRRFTQRIVFGGGKRVPGKLVKWGPHSPTPTL